LPELHEAGRLFLPAHHDELARIPDDMGSVKRAAFLVRRIRLACHGLLIGMPVMISESDIHAGL
jgi:hypothetical protein